MPHNGRKVFSDLHGLLPLHTVSDTGVPTEAVSLFWVLSKAELWLFKPWEIYL